MAHWKRYDFYAGKNGKNGHFRPFSPVNHLYINKHTDQTDWCTQNVNTSMERGDHCRHFGINFIIVSSLIRSQRSFEFVSIFTDELRFETNETASTNQVISQKVLDLEEFYWYHMKANYSGFHLMPIAFAYVNYQRREIGLKLNDRIGPPHVYANLGFLS